LPVQLFCHRMPTTKKIPPVGVADADADQRGTFVSWTMIDAIDSRLSAMFVTIEAVRHFMDESDDGSLEWQLLRGALPETFYDLLTTLDRAGVLELTSRYPVAQRAANRLRNQEHPSDADTPIRPAASPAEETWAEMIRQGRRMMIRFLLEKALQQNNEQRVALLRGVMSASMPMGEA
ncbi:MAG: hypothetical protein ABI876_12170, partial [Bacteroidota bacterium]